MSYLSTDMSGKEIAGYLVYTLLGGSVAVGAARLANRAIRSPATALDAHRLSVIQDELRFAAGGSSKRAELRAQEQYLKGKLSNAKWETIKGFVELIPLLGPIFLLIASKLSGSNRNCYDPDQMNETYPDYGSNLGQDGLTGPEMKRLKEIRKENHHVYFSPGVDFADMRFLGINNLYRPKKLYN